MLSRIAVCLVIVGSSAGPVAADWLGVWGPPPITLVHQVRKLSQEEARSSRIVKLTGIITHINPYRYDFFLQDTSAGIYVQPTQLAAGLTLGMQIELEGRTDPGDFSPCVLATKITPHGPGKLPDTLPFNMSTEDSRWLEGQWVQAGVVVRTVRTGFQVTQLDVYTPQGGGTVEIPGEQWASQAKSLKGKTVTVRGVCVPTVTNRMISGPPKILATVLPQVPVLSSESGGTSHTPPRMIDHLLRFSPSPHLGTCREKIVGVVTAIPLPNVLCVQDETGGAAVWTNSPPSSEIVIGDRVEAVGYLRIDGRRISLVEAKVTNLGKSPLPSAYPISSTELANGIRDALLVRLEAQVEGVRDLLGWTAVVMVDGVVRFEVYVPGSPEQNEFNRLEPGSRVAVTGVSINVRPDGKPWAGPSLYLPTAKALTLLEPPPRPPSPEPVWWSATRVAYLCGGFLAVSLFGGSWLFVLRHQVRKATGQVKQQYEEKAKLERQLREAAKLEAVGRLAGGIAHDFNNLLTVINGCAELLADETHRDGGGRLAELTDDIRRAGERAAALTGQLLTFSRKREVMVSAVDINEVLSDTVRLLDRVIGENILIQTNLDNKLPLVWGEPGLLHQVVMNLAVNAKDAMPGGGTLILSTRHVTEPLITPARPEGAAVSLRQFVRLTVTDTGMGMTDEVKGRIFEPFFTTKEIGSGTGLGLATVYGIIQTIRGRIRVDSAVGRGTTFHIDLRIHGDPMSDADLALHEAAPMHSRRVLGQAKLGGTTILIVEDNAMVRDLLVTSLIADGATVLAAENSAHALRVLADYPSSVDVMVTDVVMPGMSGRKLADRVRLDRPKVQVVFMSGYTADEVLREGVLADQVEFLQKPFTPDHLTNRLVEILERRPK